jgi:hypothetical protein
MIRKPRRLGGRHLLSYNRNGIELQTYAAIPACLLISLWTGRKPTLRTFEMLCWYFTGMASEEELLARIARLQKTGFLPGERSRLLLRSASPISLPPFPTFTISALCFPLWAAHCKSCTEQDWDTLSIRQYSEDYRI